MLDVVTNFCFMLKIDTRDNKSLKFRMQIFHFPKAIRPKTLMFKLAKGLGNLAVFTVICQASYLSPYLCMGPTITLRPFLNSKLETVTKVN